MSFTLQKLAAALLSPLGTALVLWLLALIAWHIPRPRWQAAGRWTGIAGLLWLWLWSTPLATEALARQIESLAGPRHVHELPSADVIVVLGGALRPPRGPGEPYPDMNASADRVWHAARLYHARKAPFILASGGTATPGTLAEAGAIRELLRDLGVPEQAIVLDDQSQDTVGNAGNSARIMRERRWNRALLVTSALHMPRASRLFQRAGVNVIPAPTDFDSGEGPLDIRHLIPSAGATDLSARAVKELAGMLYDR